MTERALRQLAYDNHLRTLHLLGVGVDGLVVFDADRHLIWHDGAEAGVRRAMREALEEEHRLTDDGGEPDSMRRLAMSGGAAAFAMTVTDEIDGPVLDLVLRFSAEVDALALGQIDAALQAVTANILTEFRLNRELEAMAGELSDRYEELNLVFQADAASPDGVFGQESLRRLVRDTTEFLDVAMAALLMPVKELQLFHSHEHFEVTDVAKLLGMLGGRSFERVREAQAPIVINGTPDLLREGLPREIACKLLMVPVQGAGAEPVGLLLIARNPDQQDFSNSDRNLLEVMATKITKILQVNFDGLTGLENSHSFEWAIDQALQQANGRGVSHAVLHVDVDRIGVVNDLGGRKAGDAVLRTIGKILASRVRAQDSVARISGDVFGVLLESCPLSAAASLAGNISQEIEKTEFHWKGMLHPLSVCIGIAPISPESETVAAVLSSAEVACEAAKEKGRNRIQVYEHNNVDLLRRRGEFRWVGRIQAALREDRFELYAQRIQALNDEHGLPHYEVLVRMLDENGDPVSPTQFIPAAEHYHLMPALDRWIIRRAVDLFAKTAALLGGAPLQLSVNLSGQSLTDEQLRPFAAGQLRRLGTLAEYLCFEITESAAISNMEEALDFIGAFKRLGCRFSLDDFGSGLSSFAYLQRFDVDYLKLDGSFVRRIVDDRVAESMVSAINQVGQVMGIKTVAEFVEDGEIDQRLRAIGVDYGQGYHYHRPEPLRAVLQGLIRAQSAAQA